MWPWWCCAVCVSMTIMCIRCTHDNTVQYDSDFIPRLQWVCLRSLLHPKLQQSRIDLLVSSSLLPTLISSFRMHVRKSLASFMSSLIFHLSSPSFSALLSLCSPPLLFSSPFPSLPPLIPSFFFPILPLLSPKWLDLIVSIWTRAGSWYFRPWWGHVRWWRWL